MKPLRNLLAAGLAALACLSFTLPAYAQTVGTYVERATGNTKQGIGTGSMQAQVSASPTVTASSVYAAGNEVGGLMTFTGAVQVSSGTGLLQKVIIDFKSAQTGLTDLVIFDSNPTGTTTTDKTAFSLATADFARIVAVVHIADCTSLGTPSVCQAQNLAIPVKTSGSANLFGVLITRGTPTFTATSDVSVFLQIIQD